MAACGRASEAPPVPGDAGPGGGPSTKPNSAPTSVVELVSRFDAKPTNQLDLLFVIDNSARMAEAQKTLGLAFPAFLEAFKAGVGLSGSEQPDMNIGFITTDVGAGREFSLGTCVPLGDRGRFQVKAGCGLEKERGYWMSLRPDGSRNFTGSTESTVECLANVGVGGCGFRHSLQALRAALSSANPENKGFLRASAHLAVVIVTNDDDCSAPVDSNLFQEARPGQNPALRCALEGHACRGAPIRAAADFSSPLAECDARAESRLIDVREIVRLVQDLKRDRGERISVTAIQGWSAEADAAYRLTQGDEGLVVAPICTSAGGTARPGLRLKSFVDAFGGKVHPICTGDFSPALRQFGASVASVVAGGCIAPKLRDVQPAVEGVQAECRVTERTGATQTVVPPCAPASPRPCWRAAGDPACGGEGLRLRIERDGPPPPMSVVEARCLSDAAAPAGTGAKGAVPGDSCGEAPEAGPETSTRTGHYDTGASQCTTRLCTRPARDFDNPRNVDTAPYCSRPCTSDADCAGLRVRDRRSAADRRCQTRFVCAVPFQVGPLGCSKICTCADFSVVAPAACGGR